MSSVREIKDNSIAELAESIADKYFPEKEKGLHVDPTVIAEAENILITHDFFDDDFLGAIIHYPDEHPFHIFINKSKHSYLEHRWTRSTIGHELGHYFINEHREKLEKGIPLSYDGQYNYSANKLIEQEAQLFSANVLMPKRRYINLSKEFTPGMECILAASEYFHTSVSSSSFQYSRSNIIPCITIKWDNENKIQGRWISKGFQKIVSGSLLLKYNLSRPRNNCKQRSYNNSIYSYSETYLSSWFFNLKDYKITDISLIEESITLGNYGGVTVLYPAS